MCAADVFCLSSSREGWPNVVHEALACGTPVVATEVGAIPELLCRSEYGLIVPPNDPAALENGVAPGATDAVESFRNIGVGPFAILGAGGSRCRQRTEAGGF